MSELALRQFKIIYYDFSDSKRKEIKLYSYSVKELKKMFRKNHYGCMFESISDVATGEELL